MYRLENSSRRVEKEILTLPTASRERIIKAIGDLANEPRPVGTRKLAGEMQGAWRIRVGDYRILYDIDDGHHVVTILAVLHRREAYR